MEPSFALPDASFYSSGEIPAMPARKAVFELAQDGTPQVDAMTQARLDVLLSGMPETLTLQDKQRLQEAVKAGLPADAQAHAVQILDAYMAYRDAERNLEVHARNVGGVKPEDMREQLVALRRKHMGEQLAGAMFAAQEAQERLGIAVARIDAAPDLSPSEKWARIDALQRTMPTEATAQGQDKADVGMLTVYALDSQVAALRQAGAPETEVWKLRQETLGPEDAQAITEMETQQTQWVRRYKAFSEQKRMALSTGLAAEQVQATTEALLRQHYAEQELDTARAYDATMWK
jgi:lipase chaperone LimK